MLFLFDCVNTVIFVVLAKIFLDLFLHPRLISNKYKALILIAWMIAEILVVNLLQDVFILKAVTTICCTALASFCLFSDGRVKKIVLSVIHYGLVAAVEIPVYLIAIQLTSYVQIKDVKDTLINVFGGVISAIALIIVFLIIRLFLKKEEPSMLSGVELAKYLAFPIASISMIAAFAYFGRNREVSTQEIHFLTFIAIVFLLSNVYMYWLLKTDVTNKILREKSTMTEAHARELSALYEQIREEHKTIAGIEHEYKNHMTVISSLAASKKVDELNDYLQNMKEFVSTVDVIDTGNAVCSALFNAKYAESIRKGIQVRFNISNLEGVKIRDEELVVILSNLFNNAIAACEKSIGKKVIELKIDNSQQTLFISFANTYNDDAAEPKSSLMNGHGLKNIQRIVDLHGGQMDIIKDDRFTVRLIIP